MDKELYRDLRGKPNFIFLYYLEEGGKVRDEDSFKRYLIRWFSSFNMQWDVGVSEIIRQLDSKHQYIKK